MCSCCPPLLPGRGRFPPSLPLRCAPDREHEPMGNGGSARKAQRFRTHATILVSPYLKKAISANQPMFSLLLKRVIVLVDDRLSPVSNPNCALTCAATFNSATVLRLWLASLHLCFLLGGPGLPPSFAPSALQCKASPLSSQAATFALKVALFPPSHPFSLSYSPPILPLSISTSLRLSARHPRG